MPQLLKAVKPFLVMVEQLEGGVDAVTLMQFAQVTFLNPFTSLATRNVILIYILYINLI